MFSGQKYLICAKWMAMGGSEECCRVIAFQEKGEATSR